MSSVDMSFLFAPTAPTTCQKAYTNPIFS